MATKQIVAPPEVLEKMERANLSKLKTYPGNPRRGNVELIKESLVEHGQYVPIVVQQSTNFVLKGNHTYMAAKQLKWKTMWVVYVDVADDEAKKIVVVDNRSSDVAEDDMQALAELLASMETPGIGTGYTDDEVNAIISMADIAMEEVMSATGGPSLGELTRDPIEGDFGDDALLDEEGEDVSEFRPTEDGDVGWEDDDEGESKLEEASEDLGGIVQLKEDVFFDGVGYLEIPVLRSDMLVEKLPSPLLTWAGMVTRDWPDQDVWWWFNYGSERTKGMNDASKMLLAFYAYDHHFDNWFWYPNRYVAKALNTGVKMAITPNFSCEEMPRALSIWALYRSRWLGRFMQEAGIRIIPDIEWRVGERKYLDQYVLPGVPRNLPYISIQAQNLQTNSTKKDAPDAEKAKFERQWKEDLIHIVETLNPSTLIVYSGEAESEVVKSLGLKCDVHWQKTRLMMWNELAPKREKRTTL